jgi:hypothetical protein
MNGYEDARYIVVWGLLHEDTDLYADCCFSLHPELGGASRSLILSGERANERERERKRERESTQNKYAVDGIRAPL